MILEKEFLLVGRDLVNPKKSSILKELRKVSKVLTTKEQKDRSAIR